jgi:hypothetical protein
MFADTRKTILFANNNKSKNIFDVDALAFINLANITSNTEKNAINNLYKNLKGVGIQNTVHNFYNNLTAFYLFVGGTATKCSYNGKNPSISNTYNLIFNGGVTYSNNGVKFNGINGYANTNIPQNIISTSANGMSVYFLENVKRDEVQIGYVNRTSFESTEIGMGWALNSKTYIGNKSSQQFTPTTFTNINGLIRNNRQSSTAYKLFRNGLQIQLLTATGNVDANTNTIIIGAERWSTGNTVQNFSNKTFAYAEISISYSLTNDQELIYYNCIQQYQTELSRSV